MGLQVPRRVHTEGSKKGAVRATARAPGRGVSRVGAAQGKLDRRGSSDGRSRAYDDRDTTEVRGIERGGVHQGEKCDSPGSGVRGTKEKLCGAKFLGAGVLCFDRRAGRGGDPQLHPGAREGRRTIGPTRTVEMIRHRIGGAKSWGRVSDPV